MGLRGDANSWCAHRFVGAALSMVDMVTDVQVIAEYLNTPDKEAYAYPLMGMVGMCLFIQLLVVFLQTRKAPKAKMAKEMTIVLTGLKPGFDAYQVAKGAEQSVGAVLDPATELATEPLATAGMRGPAAGGNCKEGLPVAPP